MAEPSGTTPATNPTTRKHFRVISNAGQPIDLLALREKDVYEAARDKYLSENAFTVASDLRALDRLLLFEVQVFRWQVALASGEDLDRVSLDAADEVNLRRAIKDTEGMISQLQNDLGLTKVQRDKAQDAESLPAYLQMLREKAKAHGIRRDKQTAKAIELMNELFAVVGAFTRSDLNEKRKLGFETADEIVEWVWEVLKPQFDEVDKHYRETNQRMWIRQI